jgi:hypothetical protein
MWQPFMNVNKILLLHYMINTKIVLTSLDKKINHHLNSRVGLASTPLRIILILPRIFYTFVSTMLPDYPHKIFNDKRTNYSLLMETLAMDAMLPSTKEQ